MDRTRILALAQSVAPALVEWRRHLHMHPELSFQEQETATFVAAGLREFGYVPQEQVGGGFGVTAMLEGGRPGPTVALRADMDALPILEESGVPFASTVPGCMHACGHDAHTAMLLGAARLLRELREQVPGRVLFLFQPAEEKPPGGAIGMVQAGVLAGVDAVFGLHVANGMEAGHMAFRTGPGSAASDRFRLIFKGKGGHAAHPHSTVDAIAMAGQAISALQNVVSRMVAPTDSAVMTIGMIQAGTQENVIAEEATLRGTIRSLDAKVRDLVPQKIEQVAAGIAAAFGGAYEFEMSRGYPVLPNDPAMTAVARRAAEAVLGPANVHEAPLGLGGEDFAYFAEARPGCFGRLGTGFPDRDPVPGHSPRFVINEAALPVGVAFYLSLILNAAAEEFGQ